jgi:hypothetical protein
MEKLDAVKQGLRQEAAELVAEMQATAGEIRLKFHLAGAESRDIWRQLEPQLAQFGRRVEKASDSALGDVRKAGKELKSSLERLCHDLRQR